MALVVETSPNDFGRIYDTNRLMYKFSSDQYTQPNFRFKINIYVGDVDSDPISYTQISTVRKRPLSDGTVYFNPAELVSNYLTYDLNINISGLTEALNSNVYMYLEVGEEFGTTPALIRSINTDAIMLYNGLQEYIPYDIEDYGGGNLQWVMSGVTVTQNDWVDCGYLNNINTGTISSGEIKLSDPSAGFSLTGVTTISLSYTDSSGNDITSCINNIGSNEYIRLQSSTDVNKTFFFTYTDQTQSSTSTIWEGINYKAVGASMPSSGFTEGEKLLLSYTELDETTGQGKFLTDALDYQVDTYDYSNLYFISSTEDRPEYARLKVWYWSDGIESVDPGGGGSSGVLSYTNNATDITRETNISISSPNVETLSAPDPNDPIEDPGEPVKPIFKYFISSYTTGFTLDYTNVNNQMYYIPAGPTEMSDLGMFTKANNDGGWVSYRVDLTDTWQFPTKIYNKYPIYYYKKNKCNKYEPIQLFWLNPHGGFDNYTFYKKNYVEYDVERTLWNHRFSDTYTLGERGKTVYKTQTKKKIILNTDYLSASESQTLSQLMKSPEVYAVYKYRDNVYKIPYLVEDTKFQYKELKNEKAVVMEITIYPAWDRTSQTS